MEGLRSSVADAPAARIARRVARQLATSDGKFADGRPAISERSIPW